jgi:alkyl sulfatase BDS1-like metallo-beta-lactamase superfamily hydrolase
LYLPIDGPDSRFKNTIVPGPVGFVPVDTPVENGQRMNIAGLEVVFYTEGIATDTSNQVLVWLPERRIVMNNILWGWFPNIYSARGGRYRDPVGWMQAVDVIRKLKPEILLSTHSTSVVGNAAIEKRLQDYHDGLAFVLDQSLKGILLGQGPDELRYSVQLPKRLREAPILIQNYGELSIMPPRIFTAIFGQFDRNAATLIKLQPTEEAERMINAMGGEGATYNLSADAFAKGDFVWSCQLADYLVKAHDVPKNRQLKANCLRQIAYRATATNTRSWYLSQALELEGKTAILKSVPAFPAAVATNLADYINFYRVRVNPERSADTDKVLALQFDNGRRYALHIRRSIVDFVPDLSAYTRAPDVTVSMTPGTWTQLFNNLAEPSALIDRGDIKVVQGDPSEVKQLFSMFDPVFDWKNDKALKALAEMLKANSNLEFAP